MDNVVKISFPRVITCPALPKNTPEVLSEDQCTVQILCTQHTAAGSLKNSHEFQSDRLQEKSNFRKESFITFNLIKF